MQLKNKAERERFLENYKTWELWKEIPEIEVKLYRYAFISTGAVDMLPAADVAEVARCGQCKLWKINPNNLYGGQCRYSECASIDHFCSRGIRKDGSE